MDADFSVELGPPSEEATLEFPWRSESADGPRYFDLKRQPEMLAQVAEAAQYPELGELLKVLNSPASIFETAKCDVWLTDELTEAEQILEAACKMSSYVDLIFAKEYPQARLSFFDHETAARDAAELLRKESDFPAAVEIIVRRCYYHEPSAPKQRDAALETADQPNVRSGFYLTVYVSGYGDDEREARKRWKQALELVGVAFQRLKRSS